MERKTTFGSSPRSRMNRLRMLILPLTAVLLAGCMRVGVDVELRRDGTASVVARYGMMAEYASEDDFRKDGHEPIHFTAGGDDYIGYEEKDEFQSYDELNKELVSLSEDGTSLFKTANASMKKGLFTTKYVFDATSAPLTDDGEDISALIVVDFSLRMPGTPKNVEGGEILEDGSVRFIFMPDIDNHFHAESSELNVVNVLIAVAVVIIAAMAAGIVISKRNRY